MNLILKKVLTPPNIDCQYQKLKTELAICQTGKLSFAFYEDENTPELIITKLQKDLPNCSQIPIQITEYTFESIVKQISTNHTTNHVLGIEALPEKYQADFLVYTNVMSDSTVIRMLSFFLKQSFYVTPDFHHWVSSTYIYW